MVSLISSNSIPQESAVNEQTRKSTMFSRYTPRARRRGEPPGATYGLTHAKTTLATWERVAKQHGDANAEAYWNRLASEAKLRKDDKGLEHYSHMVDHIQDLRAYIAEHVTSPTTTPQRASTPLPTASTVDVKKLVATDRYKAMLLRLSQKDTDAIEYFQNLVTAADEAGGGQDRKYISNVMEVVMEPWVDQPDQDEQPRELTNTSVPLADVEPENLPSASVSIGELGELTPERRKPGRKAIIKQYRRKLGQREGVVERFHSHKQKKAEATRAKREKWREFKHELKPRKFAKRGTRALAKAVESLQKAKPGSKREAILKQRVEELEEKRAEQEDRASQLHARERKLETADERKQMQMSERKARARLGLASSTHAWSSTGAHARGNVGS